MQITDMTSRVRTPVPPNSPRDAPRGRLSTDSTAHGRTNYGSCASNLSYESVMRTTDVIDEEFRLIATVRSKFGGTTWQLDQLLDERFGRNSPDNNR